MQGLIQGGPAGLVPPKIEHLTFDGNLVFILHLF